MEHSQESQASTAPSPIQNIRRIEPLPPSNLYNSFEDLLEAIQHHQRTHGAAVIRRNAGNYRVFEGETTSRPSCYTLLCDRGHQRPSISTGLRRPTSHKRNCPFKIAAAASKAQGWKWKYRVIAEHDHEPSLDPSAHPIPRRRTPIQRDLEASLTRYRGLPAREMAQVLRDQSPDPAFFRDRDIYNDRQRLREQGLGGLSPTQAWLKILRDEGLKHVVEYDDQQRVRSLVWTYP